MLSRRAEYIYADEKVVDRLGLAYNLESRETKGGSAVTKGKRKNTDVVCAW
jgi:hypothetical protein